MFFLLSLWANGVQFGGNLHCQDKPTCPQSRVSLLHSLFLTPPLMVFKRRKVFRSDPQQYTRHRWERYLPFHPRPGFVLGKRNGQKYELYSWREYHGRWWAVGHKQACDFRRDVSVYCFIARPGVLMEFQRSFPSFFSEYNLDGTHRKSSSTFGKLHFKWLLIVPLPQVAIIIGVLVFSCLGGASSKKVRTRVATWVLVPVRIA
jgi:hypothetical protein